jgi:hypothetical protein
LGSHAHGDEVLGSSLITMPRMSKSKLDEHPSRHAARHARVAYLRTRSKNEFWTTRIKIQDFCGLDNAHHKTPRGGAVCGAG